MSKDPAFLFYPNDYIGGTMGMTFEEKGAYIELLMMQFNRGHMSGHMIGQEIGQLWDTIKVKFIQDSEGLWYNERLEIEQNKRKAFTDSRKNNLTGKNQYSHKKGHKTLHKENENENENITINDNIPFSDFWNLYDKKKGAKAKCEKKWNKLKDSERLKIVETLPDFKASIKDKQYQPFPETYLNQRRWEDEIENTDKDKYLPRNSGKVAL